MRKLFVLALAAALTTACRAPKWDTPEDAYVSFSRALQRGELKLAYEALSADTRKLFEERAKEISTASGGAVRDDPALLAFATGAKPQPLNQVKVVKQEETSAILAATAKGRTEQVRMVKEGDRWKVDLSSAFEK